MLCRYCGTDNPGIHRFCGMCGKPLEDEPAAEFGSPKKDSRLAPEAQTETAERAPERPVPAPAYTGGIFNLGAPSESSGSADYLLEDDEPRSGKGLLLLGVVAVALVVGLGWMRFRQTGLPGLKGLIGPSSSAKPSASTDAPAPSQTPSDGSNGAPGSSTPNAPEQPPASGTAQTASPAPVAPSQSDTSASQPPASTPPPPTAAAPSITPIPSGDGPAGATAQAAPEQPASKPAEHPDEAASTTTPAGTPPPEAAHSKPAPAAADTPDVPEKPKKLPKPTPSKPEDTVALGEKYLYGRGVPQSCEKGLRYMKPAAEQSNNKAMITMGALYATGHCTSRDLPTAYRYFALALRQDPSNSALKQNVERVWGDMTPSERQLAIKLTQ